MRSPKSETLNPINQTGLIHPIINPRKPISPVNPTSPIIPAIPFSPINPKHQNSQLESGRDAGAVLSGFGRFRVSWMRLRVLGFSGL